jgi:hypothetical protein
MEHGVCQICVFADEVRKNKATLILYYNPCEDYRRFCCDYKVKEGKLNVYIESLVRVVDG